MKLPEQELFTIEDVAQRWGKSLSYVQDLTRRMLLPMNHTRLTTMRDQSGKIWPKITSYIHRDDLEAFERQTNQDPPFLTVKEAAAKHRIDEKTVRRWIKDKKLKAKRGPNGRLRIYP